MDSYRLSRFFLPHPVDNLAEELIEPQSFDLENVLKSQANLEILQAQCLHSIPTKHQQNNAKCRRSRKLLGFKRRVFSESEGFFILPPFMEE